MPWLEQTRNGYDQIVFRFAGERYKRGLRTRDERLANAQKLRVDEKTAFARSQLACDFWTCVSEDWLDSPGHVDSAASVPGMHGVRGFQAPGCLVVVAGTYGNLREGFQS